MGTITRTFANNITTSGVFKPTAFNNASFDNITAVPSGAVEGGNMVLLSTQTASASASISFTTGIDSTYKEYMFIHNNIHPSVDNSNFSFQGSTDGGSSYGVTITSSSFRAFHNESDSTATLGYDGTQDLAQSTSYQLLNAEIGTDNDQSTSGILHIFNPSDTTYVKHFIYRGSRYQFNEYHSDMFVAGYFNTTSALNAFDFKFSSGNIDDGTIQMFGIL
jgi:hypothetical protein